MPSCDWRGGSLCSEGGFEEWIWRTLQIKGEKDEGMESRRRIRRDNVPSKGSGDPQKTDPEPKRRTER